MATLSAGDLVNLRGPTIHRSTPKLSVSQPATLLTAQINGTFARGARSLNFDNGTGTGFATIEAGQILEIDTATGTEFVRVKSISGSQASGTIVIDENALLTADNQVIRIKHDYRIVPVPPRITGGVFYKFFDTAYSTQNSTQNPVAVTQGHLVGTLSGGSVVFTITLASSYTIASGATISSYSHTCVKNGGGTTGITIASATSATTTLTITIAGQYVLKQTVTDSNGKTQSTFRYVFVDDGTLAYKDFTVSPPTGDWNQGGWRCSVQATGVVTLADFPDMALCVLWYENKFDNTPGYVNIWGSTTGQNIIMAGYLRTDSDNDNFDKGTGAITFDITTPEAVIDSITLLGTVSLNYHASPTTWYQLANMTVGRAVHHLLKWHSWVFETCDVLGLTDNTLKVKNVDLTEDSLLQMVNGLSYGRGIFAKLVSSRLGRLHFVTDSQMLNTAGRAALDTVCSITVADISDVIDVVRQAESSLGTAELDGFSFDGSTGTPLISICPGYVESTISYAFPEFRGTGTQKLSGQVLNDQTDGNEKVGRLLAVANNDPREFRFNCRGNYIGAFDIVPSNGWYLWGVASADLKRQLAYNGKKLLPRNITHNINVETGIIQTNVVMESEALGPDGIRGNYPVGYPIPPLRVPSWDTDGAGGGGATSDFFLAYANATNVNGEAIVGQLGSITFGAAVEFQAGTTGAIAICGLSATKALVCYTSTSVGRAKVLDIVGTVITPGSVATVNGANTLWTSVCALSATQAIATYRDSDTHGKAVILDISGSTITTGSEVEFSSVACISTCVTRLSATKAIVSFRSATTGLATTCILDVSGSTITANTIQGLTLGDADYVGICSLDSTTAIMAYRDTSTQALSAVAMTGITTSGTYGTILELDNVNDCFDVEPGMPFIRKIDGNRAFIAYQTDLSPWTIRGIVVSNSGGVLTAGASVALSDAGYDEFPTIVMPNTSTAVVLFDRVAIGKDGLYSTASVSGTTATYNNDQTGWEGDTIDNQASAELKAVS